MNDSRDVMLIGSLEDGTRALDFGRINILWRIESERGCRMNDKIDTLHRLIDHLWVANIASNRHYMLTHIRIGKVSKIEGPERVAPGMEVSNQIDAQEPGTACN